MKIISAQNLNEMELFERELVAYELSLTPNAGPGDNYLEPTQLIKMAMLTLVSASPSHTYSMMRCLVAHIKGQLETSYSDHTLITMASNTVDAVASNLIMNIVYVTRSIITGEQVPLDDTWLSRVDGNTSMKLFLQNYTSDDITIGKKTRGECTINTPCNIRFVKTDALEQTITIGTDSDLVKLTANLPQKIKFDLSKEAKSLHKLAAAQTIIMPQTGRFILDGSVSFTPDAQMQAMELRCFNKASVSGVDTLVMLPGLFYSLALSIMTNDGGDHWLITELNILPPCLVRELT